MKSLRSCYVVLLIIEFPSFVVVPFPYAEHHGISVGDAHVGVTTEHDQKIPPAISVVLVVAGAGLLIAGRKS